MTGRYAVCRSPALRARCLALARGRYQRGLVMGSRPVSGAGTGWNWHHYRRSAASFLARLRDNGIPWRLERQNTGGPRVRGGSSGTIVLVIGELE